MSKLDLINNWNELATASRYDSLELAKKCGVSPSQLRRYFSRRFNLSPQAWLNELRLESSARLLARGLSVKEVAYSLGYCDSSQLCHSVKRRFGLTPLQLALAAKRTGGGVD